MALIVEKTWRVHGRNGGTRQGWYLFGCVPLFVRDLTVRED